MFPTKAAMEVSVIGGYLGVGKTTLVNHILRNASERIAVLVNDFGDINIDKDLIDASDDSTISLTNGCICCSLVDGFAAALEAVASFRPPPGRLVIEASGVADPGAVAAYGHAPGLVLDAVIVVADADRLREQVVDPLVGQTVVSQLTAADVIVLNKIDLVDDLATTHAQVRELNPDALLIQASHSEVSLDLLFGREVRKVQRSTSHIGEFESRTHQSDQPLSRNALETLINELPRNIQRVKGIVRLTESPQVPMVFQLVGRKWELRALADRTNSPEGNQLVAIGPKGSVPTDWDRTLRSGN
ncbi:MAG: GTP-binding protein [Actinomycetota bacterium]|nr:GTP-binding protein [Actinomycetota bacterium]